MTAQEAIKWIRLDIEMAKFDPNTGEEAYLNEDAKNVIEAQEMAIKALEKQKQKKPVEGYVFSERFREKLLKRNPNKALAKGACCSNCGRYISDYECEFPFCRWCGQVIDWRKE